MGYDYSLPQTLTALQGALASEDEVVMVAVDDSLVVGYCHAQLYRLRHPPPLQYLPFLPN